MTAIVRAQTAPVKSAKPAPAMMMPPMTWIQPHAVKSTLRVSPDRPTRQYSS